MRFAAPLTLLALLAGCPGDDQGGPDAMAGSGLVVSWLPTPAAVPGPVDDKLALTSARFALRSFRVIGDAGAGDPRTTVDTALVRWDAGVAPMPIGLAAAPPGLYARMAWELDGGAGLAYELTGTVEQDDVATPFAIRDAEALPVSLDLAVTAEPGVVTTIVIRVELDAIVDAVDFEAVPLVGGVRVLAAGDPQLPRVRTEVAKAFGFHDSDQ
ncbi:MAG: hypothetical protein R3B06_11735 [Kofleriaceae bacterium]